MTEEAKPENDGHEIGPTAHETAPTADVEQGASAAVALASDEARLLGDRIRAVEQERDALTVSLQRLAAEFENYKKRVAREMAEEQQYGIAKLVREILPALDNLERALEAAGNENQSDTENPLLQGVAMVRSQFLDVLRRFGITRFDPNGQLFDASQHEAVRQEARPGAQPGTVVEVLEAGYRLHDRVLRPAKVVVAAAGNA